MCAFTIFQFKNVEKEIKTKHSNMWIRVELIYLGFRVWDSQVHQSQFKLRFTSSLNPSSLNFHHHNSASSIGCNE
jgi:hypothetical protein